MATSNSPTMPSTTADLIYLQTALGALTQASGDPSSMLGAMQALVSYLPTLTSHLSAAGANLNDAAYTSFANWINNTLSPYVQGGVLDVSAVDTQALATQITSAQTDLTQMQTDFGIPQATSLMPYTMQLCLSAVGIQQDICNQVLDSMTDYSNEKLQLAQALSTLQAQNPVSATTSTTLTPIASDGSRAAAMKAVLEQFGIDTSQMQQDSNGTWGLPAQQFQSLESSIQGVMDQCDEKQQEALTQYNKHESDLDTGASVLSKIIEAMSTVGQDIASEMR